MSDKTKNRITEALANSLDISDDAYETAGKRYEDLGEWFNGPNAKSSVYSPRIYSQGSFRLGTVIRPLSEEEEYDLDVGCRLEKSLLKTNCTQEQLKELVGEDVEGYRNARRVKEEKEEKHRCWRLNYADKLKFHMDIVPSIPETGEERQFVKSAMLKAGSDYFLAETVSNQAGSITDNRHPSYKVKCSDWRISNSEGYALWFESRMKLAAPLLEKRAFEMKAASIDKLPTFQWRTPLQRCVQILKRHRNVMYAEYPDLGPISVIITTLSARAYQGEADVGDALDRILTNMGDLVSATHPRIPNPVNPAEDFADRWYTAEGKEKRLEDHFWHWLAQAKADFQTFSTSSNAKFISEQAMQKFGSTLREDVIEEKLGSHYPSVTVAPKSHQIVGEPAKPWRIR